MKEKSFTLIELLVVIAVIWLLASIVLVSLQGTRRKARIAKSLEFSHSIQHVLGVDVVGIWSFDEGSGNTAYDGSGYGNNGTINGASYTDDTPHKVAGAGEGKYALYFDGNDDVDCGDDKSLRLGPNMTIEVWINPSANVSDWARIVGKGNSTYRNYGLWRQTDGDILWQIYSAGGNGNCWNNGGVGDPLNASVGRWMHVVVTYDGTNMKVYSNGALRKTCSYSQIPYTSSDPATIGYAGFHTYFNGIIDEVRIYSVALTTAQIQKHYTKGAPKRSLTKN